MPLCSGSVFQLPIPPVLYLIPPSHPLQWLCRLFFLLYSVLVAFPLILVLAPISVWLHGTRLRCLAPLAIHPDNLPPSRTYASATRRAIAVYAVGNLVWAITCIGTAPESTHRISRLLAKVSVWIGNMISRHLGRDGPLVLGEVEMEPLSPSACLGVLAEADLERRPVLGFTLRRTAGARDSPELPLRPRRAILFLAGGGYVMGWPLVHPFVPSLLAALPPNETFLLAPNVRKASSKDGAFPIPLLDALAAYAWLRHEGWASSEITLMGDSAGGGLCWSVAAYLAILHEETRKQAERSVELGVPGGVVLISPWVSLPPTPPSHYPDLINASQLLNAARCYLARFPVLKHRPNPFSSEIALVLESLGRYTHILLPIIVAPHRLPWRRHTSEVVQEEILQPADNILGLHVALTHWLEAFAFASLSSHHPLISPGTDVTSPFVGQVLEVLSREGTRMMMHVGTAEWFCAPALALATVAEESGLCVSVQVERGGLHIESSLLPGEVSGPAGRLVEGIRQWMDR